MGFNCSCGNATAKQFAAFVFPPAGMSQEKLGKSPALGRKLQTSPSQLESAFFQQPRAWLIPARSGAEQGGGFSDLSPWVRISFQAGGCSKQSQDCSSLNWAIFQSQFICSVWIPRPGSIKFY